MFSARLVRAGLIKLVADRANTRLPRNRHGLSHTTLRLLSADDVQSLEPLSARNLIVRVPAEDNKVRLLDVFVLKCAPPR